MVLYVPYTTQPWKISSGGKRIKQQKIVHIFYIFWQGGGVMVYTWYQLLVLIYSVILGIRIGLSAPLANRPYLYVAVRSKELRNVRGVGFILCFHPFN